jgi:hypothetical protein
VVEDWLGPGALDEPEVPGELGPCDGELPDPLGLLLGLLLLGPPPPPLPLEAPLPLGFDAELCGVLGLLTGLLGVPDGVVLGFDDGVLELPDGEVLGVLLGVPGPPTPLIETIWPLGSKRTCAVHGPVGSAEEST